MHDKSVLRRTLRRTRASLPPAYRDAVAARLPRLARALIGRGKRLGAYVASGSELDLTPLMNAALWRGARVFVPSIPRRHRRLWFTEVDGRGRWYREPRYHLWEYHGPRSRAESLDVLFVPLVGVDAHGFRLGQGGGFYDSSLHFRRHRRVGRKPLIVGVAFDCQKVDAVPREPWDVRLDALLTESGLLRFR
ncbi:5-formyltetrahydrofolate cyclo-ligase [Crenobacter cavernae]|uniref:5-formyltetrahydrofolate cyclo-ligase n=1 Tax=Crenobacter cavernae TaxID=2290923 RepID=UPI001F0BADAE|nr:5-formyltetrahydrofolate cyclo-ligase [Crenobacter cavernae]